MQHVSDTRPSLEQLGQLNHSLRRVWDNLDLLVMEVRTLVGEVHELVVGTSQEYDKPYSREDYIDNLETTVDNEVFEAIRVGSVTAGQVNLLRAVQAIASNLERIADFAINIIAQLQYFKDPRFIDNFAVDPFFEIISDTLGSVEQALIDRDMKAALTICRAEFTVDELFRGAFNDILGRLKRGEGPEDLLTSIFIFRYLERMGDSLLNIGEAVLFSAVGERIKISHYEALEQTLAQSDTGIELDAMEYEGIWGTRSGARIGCVHRRGDAATRWVIFKEGQTRKILEEKQGLERWNELYPGLPPRVVGFHEHGTHSSLLLEYLEGQTLQQIVLENTFDDIQRALTIFFSVLSQIWEGSVVREPCAPKFVRQLEKRLPDVFKVHPGYDSQGFELAGARALGLRELVYRSRALDAELIAPFQVQIHGDFNTDNVIISMADERVRLIDLHRTQTGDFMQDVSVFLISNFRMPTTDGAVRRRLDFVTQRFLNFARGFAEKYEDHTFDARLAAGLARSFLTSTRFVVNEEIAASMRHRAVFLLELLDEHQGRPWQDFKLPEAVLAY